MPRTLRILLLFLFTFVALRADPSRATSIYSMVFVGERLESGDARAIALGGSTQLFTDSLAVLHMNPALLSRVPRVTIGATQYAAVDQGRSSDYTERDVSVVFSGFRLLVPIVAGVRLSVGYIGRFNPDGSFAIRGVTDGGEAYTNTLTKAGGIYSVPFTAAFDVTRYASLGLTFSLEQGTVEEEYVVNFENRSIVDGAGIKKEDLGGTGFGGGLVLRPYGGLTIGAMYESKVDYDTDVQERFSQAALDTFYSSSVTLPSRTNVGISWRIRDRFLVLASAAWSDFRDSAGLGFPTSRLGEERSYAFGFEYAPGIRVKSIRLPIRVSFSFHELPFDHPQGQNVSKYLVGLGTGIAVAGGKGKLDLAIRAGKIGSLGDNRVEDRLIRIYVGLSGSELWKRKGGRTY
ncbi:MAG: hypothetical protein JSW58_09375 [Candidatus Latescibacterota bacterium]|nr:MAG: hypothetical protein JSW58_09375 [Candidatus Latescibacterota bacterium]